MEKNGGTMLVLKFVSESFSLEKAVCNHGFFMMAPNNWIPSTKTLRRPLRLADSTTSVTVSISQQDDVDGDDDDDRNDVIINIWVHSHNVELSSEDTRTIKAQVVRMLRMSEKDEKDVVKLHELHPEAKERGFGRLFRSPTLFEDLIKSILLCNCTFARTLKMAESLCELSGGSITMESKVEDTRKRKRDELSEENWESNFLTASELASYSEKELKERCGLGHRAKHILKVAKDVSMGRLKLDKLEDETFDYKQVYHKVSKIKGFGHFASANVLMCIGFYELVPTDSETIRHFRQVHDRKGCNKTTVEKDAKEIFDEYAPFQCLAYWMEIVAFYEKTMGKLSQLSKSNYCAVTGSLMSIEDPVQLKA